MSKTYLVARGRRNRVMRGLGGGTCKGRCRKPGAAGWKCVAVLSWRATPDVAQVYLNRAASEKEWEEGP